MISSWNSRIECSSVNWAVILVHSNVVLLRQLLSISSISQCHCVRYYFWVFWLRIKHCPFISSMHFWSFCRRTLKYIFCNLSTFCLSSVKSSSYYPMFLISLIPVVSFGQTSVLSGLFCKISHGPSESWALFTGHSSCGGPVVFLHIGHILCSALVSPAPPPNQLRSLVIEAVRLPVTLSVPFFFPLPNLVLYPEEIC